ncbi:MAG TPA: AAA family ATPase, partial [Candidatus Limnocylindrales bacterium]
MRLTRIRVSDVRRYRDLDLSLAPGLTIVRGPNEAGKSTIQRIVELALTRKVTTTGAEIEGLRPWDADEASRPVIALEFVDEDLEGTTRGTLEKAFRGPRGTVSLILDGETITDPAAADERLARMTGVPTEAFFRSTASVRHHEVSELARDEAALRDRLQASISGGDRGTSAAKKRLERAIRDLVAKGDKNPGRVKTAENQVEALRLAVESGESRLAQLERDRETLSLARERRSTAETALAERRSLLEKARQAERLQTERATASERYGRYREAVRLHEELVTLHGSHPSATALPILRQAVDRLRALAEKIATLRAALEGEVEVSFEAPPEPTWRPISRLAIGLVVVGIGLAVAGFGGRLLGLVGAIGENVTYVGAALAAVGLLLAVIARRITRSARLDQQMRDDEIDRRLRGRSQLKLDLQEAEREEAEKLASLGYEGLADAEAALEAESRHVAEIERITATLAGLVGNEPPETLPAHRDAAALDVERMTSAIDALGPIAKEPRARERLEVEVHDQEGALERARDDEANARARLEANTVDAEQVAGESERLAAWTEQLAALQRQVRVLQMTLEAIGAAEVATMRTATRYLEKRMVGDLEKVTNGRYRRVRVDDKTFDIEVWAPERADWVDARQLSQGTLDLVYLIARLGLVRLVTGDRRPPLIFDDPFVTFDDERAMRTMGLLRAISGDFQVIYLTASTRFDGIADAVVELPAPTAVDQPEQSTLPG